MHICVTVAEHSMYRSRDKEAMDALMELCELEGIIPAIESAHAMAYAFKKGKRNETGAVHDRVSVRTRRQRCQYDCELSGRERLSELRMEHVADEIKRMLFVITLKSEVKESRKINWSRRS